MHLPRLLKIVVLSLAILAPHSVFAAAGDVESYTVNLTGGTGLVLATAVQGNGQVLIGGNFTAVGGVSRNQIARVSSGGSVDPSFNPSTGGTVNCIVVQPNGRILVGSQNGAARFNADGSLDTSFNPGVIGSVNALAIQSNGSILVAGNFTSVGGTARNHIARVTSTGALDTTFNPNPNDRVHSVLVQPDGRIVFGGEFTTVGGTSRNRIARVESSGTLDTTFNPDANNLVRCLALQPDGRILLGGQFTTLGTTTRNRIARVESSGALDTTFDPNVDNEVYTIVRQADGKIIFGGLFLTLQPPGSAVPINQRHIARLSPAGAFESAFNPVIGSISYSSYVSSLSLQNDGKILLGGRFDYIDGATNGGFFTNHFGRLSNDAVTDTLTIPSASQVTWTRGGAAPELTHVLLERSTDLANWFSLGTMTRVSTTANWQSTGLSLPSTGYVRVRAQACAGFGGGSQSLVEKLVSYGGLATSNAVLSGNNLVIARGDITPSSFDHTDFGSVLMATTDSITRTFTIQNTGSATLALGTVSAQLYAFNGSYPSGFGYDGAFTVTAQPDSSVAPGGVTTFTIRFDPSGLRQIGVLDYQVYFNTNDPVAGYGFNIRGTGLNTVPTVANPIPDQSINLGTAFTYAIPYQTFSDSDRNYDSYGFPSPSYTAAPLPAGVTLNSFSGAFSGTPTAAGSTDITVTYKDSQNATVSDTFRLTVVSPNVAPTVANPIPDQNATEDVEFNYIIPANTFADVDAGNVFTYSVTGLQPWLAFNPATRTFSGTPLNEHVGSYIITVTATDNGTPTAASVSDTFSITVANVNDAPLISSPIPDQNSVQGLAFSYSFSSNAYFDLDAGTVLTYTASGVPAWLTFNPATRTFSGTPGDGDVGLVDVTLTVTDNGTPTTASVNDTFRVTVAGVNDVPVFTKGANQSLPGGTNTSQTVVAWATGISDGDSHAVQSLTFLVSNSNPGLFSVAPAIASNGTLTYAPNGSLGTATIGVSLQDDATAGGLARTSAMQTFTISLTDTTGPVGGTMTLAPASIVDAGVTLTVTFAAWSDTSAPLSYAVLVNDGVVSVSGPSSSRTITAPVTPGSYTLKGRILDSLGNPTETSQSFIVLTALESWRKLHFGSPANSGDGADQSDFDKDGVVNLVEFAFGMNPKVSDSSQLPRPQTSGDDLTMSYPVPPGVSGITYGAQWSETLAPVGWQTILNTGTAAQPVFSVPMAGRGRLFMRHVITTP